MLLVKEPQIVKRLGAIWHSVTHLKDYATLQKGVRHATVVAFDLESFVAKTNELGMAWITFSEARPLKLLVTAEGCSSTFHTENEIKVHTPRECPLFLSRSDIGQMYRNW